MGTTKGKIVNYLKSKGIRKANKEGVGEVQIEHLKFAQLVRLLEQVNED